MNTFSLKNLFSISLSLAALSFMAESCHRKAPEEQVDQQTLFVSLHEDIPSWDPIQCHDPSFRPWILSVYETLYETVPHSDSGSTLGALVAADLPSFSNHQKTLT